MRHLILIVHPNLPHFLRNDLKSNNHVRKDDLPNFLSLIEVKAFRVNYTHLLQDGGLARLAGT